MMNKEDIKKALECCAGYIDWLDCGTCPYFGHHCGRGNKMMQDALDLISEQEKEIEELKAENTVWSTQINQAYDNGYKDGYDSIEEDIIQAKIDVLTELKKRSYTDNDFMDGKWHRYVLTNDIDEMIEELKK